MKKSKVKVGDVITPGDVNVWPHEAATAKALAAVGHEVRFIKKSERDRETSADAYIDGEKWEMKAPRSSKLSAVEDNLKKATKQSDKIVFDSRRMKLVPDRAIERELTSQFHKSNRISQIRFVNRHGEVVDIE
ncbi:hypothetical protein FWF74_00800 [Candidatus Saccharibacteria bacterium]|nr:hypothetical protein [Candidatus Saccharibacteria bacterium]